MKKTLFYLFFFFLLMNETPAQQNTFEKVIDTLGCGYGGCIRETFDGGYVLCGGSTYNGNDAMVVKLDSSGTIEWAKIYTGPGSEAAGSIEQTPDSGYMVSGSYDVGLNTKSWLLRLDKNGDTLWTKTYSVGSGATNPGYQSMASVYNTIYGLTGYNNPPTNILTSYFISCLATGYVFASKTYSTLIVDNEARAISKALDNGFIIAGVIGALSGGSDVYLIRTDAYGDTLWTRSYNYAPSDAAFAVNFSLDSGFIVAALTYNNTSSKSEIFLIKTNSDGDSVWTKVLGYPYDQIPFSIEQTNDGGYAIVASSINYATMSRDVNLIKTNSNGDTLWMRWFGGTSSDYGYSVHQTKDGGYIITGINGSVSSTGAYIIKTDSMGLVANITGVPEINNPLIFSINPNPSTGLLSFVVKGIRKNNSTIEVFNTNSQLIYNTTVNNNVAHQIDLAQMPAGIYMVLLRTANKVITRKILIQK